MALVVCRDCKNENGNEAAVCPTRLENEAGIARTTSYGLSGLVAVMLVIGMFTGTDAEAGVPVGLVPIAMPAAPAYEFETTPAELSAAYEENTIAADMRFKGKRYLVRGTVEEISTRAGDSMYITMKGANASVRPRFAFLDSEQANAASLKKGQKVALLCTGAGDIGKAPVSRRCTFLAG